ncbi:MAG: DNA topoisomerase VI subunit B, partial [Halobacteria archaeon]|nr:DNA topoisomerase VI subunit B [Halobacteria archaeon]
EIVSDEVVEWDRTRGTRIELQMEGNMRARKQLHEYVKNTAVVNPHARIHLKEPDDEFDFERATDELPKKAEEIDPHPHGIELGTLIRMLKATDSYSLSGFVGNEFTRVGSKTSDSMLDGFRDRYYGREAAWSPPEPHEADLEAAVEEAVSNKGGEATSDFAERVAGRVRDEDSVSHHRLVSLVDEAADETEDGHSTTFGDTVREKTVSAVWEVITEDRGADLYRVVDDATGNRKDDETLRALAERVGARFDETDRDRATRDEVGEFVEKSADAVEELRDTTFGETARENVAEAVWGSMETVPDEVPSVNDVAEDRELARMLLESMRETDVIAPPTDCLSPITDELVEAGLRKEFDADFYAASTRDASVQSGDPFVVEAGIAYGGSLHGDSKANLLRFANRVPLVYQQGACVITEAVEDIGWKNYGLDGSKGSLPEGPAVLMVHVASTNVPFTSESKDAIASVPEIRDEVERAVREVGRELKDHINKRESR